MNKVFKYALWLMLAVTVVLLVLTMFSTKDANGDPTNIDWIIYWGYLLFGLAVASAVFGAVYGMVQNPKGIKGSLISLVLLIIVVGGAIAIGVKNSGAVIPNSAGGYFDDPTELVVSEASVLVAYVAMGAAFLAAVFAEVKGAFK